MNTAIGQLIRTADSGSPAAVNQLFTTLYAELHAMAERRLHLWVGGGIVWDSEPEAEIAASWTKAEPLLTAIGKA